MQTLCSTMKTTTPRIFIHSYETNMAMSDFPVKLPQEDSRKSKVYRFSMRFKRIRGSSNFTCFCRLVFEGHHIAQGVAYSMESRCKQTER